MHETLDKGNGSKEHITVPCSGVRRGGVRGVQTPPELGTIVVENDVISEGSICSKRFSQK